MNAIPSFVAKVVRLGGTFLIVAVGLLLLQVKPVSAQFENKPLAIGTLHHTYNEVGGETEYWWSSYGLQWPANYRDRGTLRANLFWLGAKNFTNENGESFPVKVVHVGSRATGFGEFFPQTFTTVSRFPAPEVVVDGLPSYDKLPDVDEVDPTMKYDRKIVNEINSQLGITVTRTIYALGQEDHDNYHIQEYVLTNTGNVDDDPEQELDAPVEGVYLHLGYRYGYASSHVPGQEWGANVINDIVGDGLKQYETDLRAQYTWLGNSPGAEYDPMGGPALTDDYWFMQEGDTARLTAQQFFGTATVFAPAEPGGPDADNVSSTDPSELQPSVTGFIGADHELLSANDPFNVPKMQLEYEMLSGGWAEAEHGHMSPHHADLVDKDDDFSTPEDQGDVKMADSGGQQSFHSYGPYTLEPGESVQIVQVQAADGLNRQEAIAVARGFAANNLDPQAPIELQQKEGPVALGKNEWVLTGRDSLFATFQRAIAAWESEEALPRAPLPPARFEVNSGVDQVNLAWEPMEGGPERVNWEVYRSKNHWEGSIDNNYEYKLIATLPPDATSYEDTGVQRGIEYFYYIQAVGSPADNNEIAMTRPGALRSNRHYTQTYTPASLKRPPGTTETFSVVPSPFVLSAEEDVTWPDQNRLAFLDVPGNCTIRIYTELGELVRTIEHTDGSGDEFWKLETEDRQVITSGIYIVTVENNETGEVAHKKFSVIR